MNKNIINKNLSLYRLLLLTYFLNNTLYLLGIYLSNNDNNKFKLDFNKNLLKISINNIITKIKITTFNTKL